MPAQPSPALRRVPLIAFARARALWRAPVLSTRSSDRIDPIARDVFNLSTGLAEVVAAMNDSDVYCRGCHSYCVCVSAAPDRERV